MLSPGIVIRRKFRAREYVASNRGLYEAASIEGESGTTETWQTVCNPRGYEPQQLVSIESEETQYIMYEARWFKWVAPTSGFYIFDATSSGSEEGAEALINVWEHTPLFPIDTGVGEVEFEAVSGHLYYIQVGVIQPCSDSQVQLTWFLAF